MHHIFLSPHHDDAVLSCGGTMARLARAGERVSAITVFSGDAEPPYSPLARRFHELWGVSADVVQLRRAEDAAAMSLLGIDIAWQQTLEALYRRDAGRWLYPELEQLFGPLDPHDLALVGALHAAIAPRITGAPIRLYAPLAIGRHVDHVLTLLLGRALVAAVTEVWHYEDVPYVLDPAADRPTIADEPPLRPLLQPLEMDLLDRKVEAARQYASQVAMLFGSMAAMEDRLTDYALQVGVEGPAERFWTASPPAGTTGTAGTAGTVGRRGPAR
jgi:LmbE family N-acetylglucosaminyl deacetylase